MPKKSLGQHWLKDRLILEAIADSVNITPDTTVLEIGPGLGTLTSVLLSRAKEVIAVEYDQELARKLPGQFPGKSLTVVSTDFLTYDTSTLPAEYVVVANVPYYITTKIIQRLLRAENKPREISLLVQKEVAEKLASKSGGFTPLSVEASFYYHIHLGTHVRKMYFTPPPKVDSQVVVFKKIHVDDIVESEMQNIMRVVQAGFSAPRKKIKTSLTGSLNLSKETIEQALRTSDIDPDCRAETIRPSQWQKLAMLLS